MSAVGKHSADDEQRIASRERVMLTASLSYSGGAYSVSCLVTQISATGVRISVDGDFVLSRKLRVSIPQRGIDTPARLVWRRGNTAGLAFETAATPVAEEPSPRRDRDLEEENKKLRILLAQLEQRLKDMQQGY